ncbi:MAG: 16S rRNA (cytosine967-C5)-methyltransferase [Planctomycetota bacterium]|jgi:16S rRNA (cytosine967-C5)-methyltransferase
MNSRRGMGARDAACRFLIRPIDKRLGERRRQLAEQVDSRDRALFHELVAGTTRREVTLDALLGVFSNAKVERIESRLRAILRVALYQIVYLDRIPHHSAVSEALKLIPSKRGRGFANGVLRQILRESRHLEVDPETTHDQARNSITVSPERRFECDRAFLPDPQSEPISYCAISFGFAADAAEILVKALGQEEAFAVMSRADQRPQTTIRFCGPPSQDSELKATIVAADVDLEVIDGGNGRLFGLPRGVDPASLEPFKTGQLTVQGPFAAQVAPLLDDPANQRVLDLCAPPGGKTIHLAELLPNATIVAFAQDERGRVRMKDTLKRCAHAHVSVVARPENPFSQGPFNAILLDVPCSNSGVLSRRPEARHRLNRENLASLTKLQEQILSKVLHKATEATTSTRVVYSTCSILPIENEELLTRVLKGFPRAKIMKEIRSMPSGPWQDGGYAALIEVSGQG